MWWCCGKRDINAPGCLFQKHTTREDNNLDEDGNNAGQRQIKCMCCKDYGHYAEECPKDPNIRQAYDAEDEDLRLENKQDNKKFLADAQYITLKMLTEMSKNKSAKLKGKDIMSFDDFQYQNVNQYILDIILDAPAKKEKDGSAISSASNEDSKSESLDEDEMG